MRMFSFIDGERGYCVLLEGPEGAQALRIGDGETVRAAAEGPIDEGRATLQSESGPLEISWSPAGPMLEFAIDTAVVSLYGIAASGTQDGRSMAGPGVAWELPDGGYSALRSIWAISAKSDLFVLISLRPEDARDHGEELVGAARIMARDEPYGFVEPLLSTEYDEHGIHTRATLELWAEDDGPAERGAGRRIAGGAVPRRSAGSRPPASPGSLGGDAGRRRLRDPHPLNATIPGACAESGRIPPPCRSAPSSAISAACSPRR